ncbi:fimbria/pilus outer membrane usher protein [Pseudogulbenkiania subflava]|uniref:fimbria/pilus outer membrane usher protein n=1 Tax=Pseudogulbenkiania subflava TaxID=451637 RepID=UPI00190E7F12|nr:fimbria/pilus outer membrane usher protein [Pseudogulbenkiania subflava]
MPTFRLSPISAALVCLFAGISATAASAGLPASFKVVEVEFNDQFLRQTDGGRVDVSRFNKGNAALPGTYRADLYVNQNWLGRAEVSLRQIGSHPRDVQPCFDRALLERIGVDLSKLQPEASSRLAEGACAPLPEWVSAAAAEFDNGEQRLDISLPQVALKRTARGYVDPQYWDDGVTAARLQYNANAYRTSSEGQSTSLAYLGLNAGFNAGAWRFRHLGNLNHDDRNGTHYQGVQTNLQRGIPAIRSQLTLGDAFTDGTVFDSVGFRGAQLASDDRMYPESQRGYAPTIHGIANTNARVQVRQNGNIIYETTVAAGAFVIDDLYPTGYGGDLEVVVTEADGSVRISKVPYAAAVNSLRPGLTRYQITAGQYRNAIIGSAPAMLQATVQRGFTNTLTGYGGLLAAQDYSAAALGTALNTPLGAVGMDVTQSWTRLQKQPDRNGYSLRLAYSKLLESIGTNVTLAAYRYSSRGYLNLADAVMLRDAEKEARGLDLTGIQRNRLQLTVNQALPAGYGSFYLSGSTQNYWNRPGSDTQFQVGYNNSYRRITYGISASRQYDLSTSRWDNRIMLNIGIPLGDGRHAPYSMTSLQRDSGGAQSVQQAVTGALGVDNAFTYGLSASHNGGGDTRDITSVGGNASYASPAATFTANASRSSVYRQVGGGISGGIVAYSGGVVLTPNMGDTLAIVEAKDAVGARVANASGLRIDPWGHAVVPSLTPFASNAIEIDPKGLPMNVELKSTEQHVAPTAGAVVKMRFETENTGRTAILQARTADGKPLPFGAEVFDVQGQSIGTVAQASRIIARRLHANAGDLIVKWGSATSEQCRAAYSLPDMAASSVPPYSATGLVCK